MGETSEPRVWELEILVAYRVRVRVSGSNATTAATEYLEHGRGEVLENSLEAYEIEVAALVEPEPKGRHLQREEK